MEGICEKEGKKVGEEAEGGGVIVYTSFGSEIEIGIGVLNNLLLSEVGRERALRVISRDFI